MFNGRRQRTTAPATSAAYDQVDAASVEKAEVAKESEMEKNRYYKPGSIDKAAEGLQVGDAVLVQSKATGKWKVKAHIKEI